VLIAHIHPGTIRNRHNTSRRKATLFSLKSEIKHPTHNDQIHVGITIMFRKLFLRGQNDMVYLHFITIDNLFDTSLILGSKTIHLVDSHSLPLVVYTVFSYDTMKRNFPLFSILSPQKGHKGKKKILPTFL